MNTHVVETIGQKIRRLRLEKGMTQGEVADGFVTVSMISQLENSRNTASVELLRHIAKKLQVDLHELVEDEVEQMELACQHKLIKVYLEMRQPNEAEPLLYLLRGRSDLSQAESIELTLELGECFLQQKRFDDALSMLLPLIKELEMVNYDDAHMLALIRFTIGNVYDQMQNFTYAHYNFKKAFELTNRFRTFDDLAAKIAYYVGITMRKIGHPQGSVDYLERSYDYFRENGDLTRLATTMYAQGLTYKKMHNYSRAADCFEQAQIIFHGLNMRKYAFMVQRTMASTITVNENPELALKKLSECIPLSEEEKDYPNLVLIYSTIASAHLKNHNAAEASSFLVKAKVLIEMHSLQNTPEAGDCYEKLASYYLNCQNYHESIEYALKSATIFGTIGLSLERIDALQIVVEAYQATGNLEKALEYEKQCNVLFRQIHERE